MATVLAVFLMVGCRGTGNDFQSAFHPASVEAREMAGLGWMMVAVYGSVFFGTMGLVVLALVNRRSNGEAPGGSDRFVLVAGMVVPTVILVGMLVVSLRVSAAMRAPETAFRIEVTGNFWWWEVRYPDHGIVTANEIRIPVGVPVRLELKSRDVIHSFWVPNLHGKMDMLPDQMNQFWLRADREGVYRGTCAEFCGGQHARMGIDVVALSEDGFEQWVQERTRTREPGDARGKELFFSTGCAACHAVGGTQAVSNLGPDLTHMADRLNLAASTLPNTRENLKRWIVDPQSIKPLSLMPPTEIGPEELEALLDYLQTLK
ncbi:cytochrome c oxidase subunit II [Phragmitibacter flavus]|nr:cytochrome c oxidase subunit II [Phragmitibacter flavus]